MYLSFFDLMEKPFQISTDPRFLWLGENHKEALAKLRYGLLESNGYVVLTGDVGTGKTSLVNALLGTLDENVLVANINHPSLDALDFLRFVARTYDPSAANGNKSDILLFFKTFLQQAHESDKTVLLVIDEAHRLSADLLEEIRLLSNMEQDGQRLITIFLVGQTELKPILLSPHCTALRQRITLFHDLVPLTESQTRQYVAHRLKVAGTEAQLFTPEALHAIQSFSGGYPRLINILCDRALLTGYVKERKIIDADIITECIPEISLDTNLSTPTARRIPPLSTGWRALRVRSGVWKRSVVTGLRFFSKAGVMIVGYISLLGKKSRKSATEIARSVFTVHRAKVLPLAAASVIVLTAAVLMMRMDAGQKKDDASIAASAAAGDTSGQQRPQKPFSTAAAVNPQDTQTGSPETRPDTRPYPSGGKAVESPIEPSPAAAGTLVLASAALSQKNYQTALDLLAAARSRDHENHPDFAALYSKALAGRADQIMSQSPLEARTMLDEAVAADPENSAAHFSLGKLYTRSKEYARAIEAYQRLLHLKPDFSDACFNLGFIYATTGMYAAAEEMFARVVHLKPSYLDKAFFNLAVVQQKQGKRQQSLTNLEKAIAIRPENQKARAYLEQLRDAAH